MEKCRLENCKKKTDADSPHYPFCSGLHHTEWSNRNYPEVKEKKFKQFLARAGNPVKITAFDPRKGSHVLVGVLKNGVFTKHVTAKHFMRIVGGYGIQELAFQELLEAKCQTVIIINETESYVSPIQNWIEHGKVMNFNSGNQRFLSLKYMQKKKI